MNPNITLLIILPLILSQLCFLNKKYCNKFFLVQILISIICIERSISINISKDFFQLDLGLIILKFTCDIYSYFFGILISIVFLFSILYSYSYFKHLHYFENRNKFFTNIFITISFTYANCYSGNLETLFLFYFLMILYTAPIILIRINKSTQKAYKLYTATHISCSLFLFLPVILILRYYNFSTDFSLQNSNNFSNHGYLASIILGMLIFGISKNCVIPFHQWITRSTSAPTPVSALLHSVAAVKSGSLAIIKIVVYIFSLNYTKQLTDNFWTGGWIFYLCGLTAIYSAYRAYKTTKIKYRFAYSTISQLSYILSSTLIATKIAIIGSVLHIISHSLCKITLFFIAGIFSNIYNIHNTREVTKIAPNIRLLIACLTLCGASIIGIPYLPGSFGKEFMIDSELKTHHYSALIFLICGSVINIFYIFPIFKSAFFNKKTVNTLKFHIPLTMKLTIIIAMIINFLFSFFINNIINFFKSYDI